MDAGGAPPDAAVIGSMIEELAQLAGKKGERKAIAALAYPHSLVRCCSEWLRRRLTVHPLARWTLCTGYLKEGSAAVARDLLHLLDKAAVADAIKAAPSFSAWLCSPAEVRGGAALGRDGA